MACPSWKLEKSTLLKISRLPTIFKARAQRFFLDTFALQRSWCGAQCSPLPDEDVPHSFGVTQIQDSHFLTASSEDTVILLKGAHRYVTSPKILKGAFPTRAFYRKPLRYIQALHCYTPHLRMPILKKLCLVVSGIFFQSRFAIQTPAGPCSWIVSPTHEVIPRLRW